LAAPFKVAALADTVVAAEVITVGAVAVVNASTAPKAVPSVLEAIAQ
jgi:hypothetical protein